MLARDPKTVLRLIILSAILLIAAAACQVEITTIFVGMDQEGVTADGLSYDENDIIYADPDDATPAWNTLFDGEWYGLDDEHHAISAFSFNDQEAQFPFAVGELELYLSFTANRAKVPGIPGRVFGQDIVRFYTPDGLDYEYEMLFDGSDVDLTKSTEKIDGFSYWSPDYINAMAADVDVPDDCNAGLLFVSTRGAYRVSTPHLDGGHLSGNGSDVLAFCATNLGADTAGFWFRVFQSSQAELFPRSTMTALDVYGIEVISAPNADAGNLMADVSFFFTVRAPFEAEGGTVSGQQSQIFAGGTGAGGHYVDGPLYDLNSGAVVPSVNGTARSVSLEEVLILP